jgi:hypothetical protein
MNQQMLFTLWDSKIGRAAAEDGIGGKDRAREGERYQSNTLN